MRIKRILSVVLATAMVFSTLGIGVFASDSTAVAAVGETEYTDLQGAIDAAKAGQTVTLLKDVTIDATDGKPETHAWVKSDYDVIIDLNQKTVNGAFFINGTATIKNGSIVNTNIVSCIETQGKLTLEDVNAISNRHCIRISGGTTTFNSGTYQTNGTEGTRHAVNASGDAVVNINGGTFIGAGEANLGGSGNCLMLQNNAYAIITGGTFRGANGVEGQISPNTGLVISGGTFETWNYDNYLSEGYITDNTNGKYVVGKAVAKIGNTSYISLSNAFNAATAGDKVVLLADVNLSDWTSVDIKNAISLDGNNKTITGLTAPLVNNASADFEVKNLTISNADITIVSANGKDNDSSAAALVQWANGGTLTLNNVSVKNSTIKGDGYVAALVGFVDSTSYGIVVTGGTIEGVTLTADGTVGTVAGHTYADVKVSDITVSGNSLTSTSDNGTRPDKVGLVVGRLSADTVSVSAAVNSTNAVTPKGSNTHPVIGSVPGGVAVISGGSYPTDPTVTGKDGQTISVPEGCEVTKNEDGTFGVAEIIEETIGTRTLSIRYTDTSNENKYVLQMFAGIDSLKYKEVGFVVTVGEKTNTYPITKVYQSIKVKMNNELRVITASEFSAKDNSYTTKYIYGQGINFESEEFAKENSVTYKPYAVKFDGTKIYGTSVTYSPIFKTNN